MEFLVYGKPVSGQTSMISIVIIAGMVIAMVGVAYTWAVPMVEKRITVTDFNLIEGFMLELNEKIVDIANTGSGEASILIPKGVVEVRGYDYSGTGNNSVIIDFEVSQPIMVEGSVPIRTTSLDEVADYGKSEPRTIIVSAEAADKQTHLNMTMRYRELRSTTPKGYIIALCPPGGSFGCDGSSQGGKEVVVSYDSTVVSSRDQLDGGDLTITYISIEVR